MATHRDPPDEVVSRRPDVVQWWVSGEHHFPPPWLPMEERMIHRYFSEQEPFFDWTSKNGLALEQSRTDRQLFDIAHNRQAFEERIRKGRGVEYLISGEPKQVPGAPDGTKSGVWNLRKQMREKRRDEAGRQHDEVEVLGSYYIVGENVYQAPSVADVVGNRLLDATANLSKFFEKAAVLPTWSPTGGYTYLPPSSSKRMTAAVSSTGTPTPALSREGSVAPGADVQSLLSGSAATEAQSGPQSTLASARDTQLLAQSLQMAIQFGDEYMDENPLLGEPGHFTFTSTTAAVKKRKADEALAAAKTAAKLKGETDSLAGKVASPSGAPLKVEKPPSPPAVMTEGKAGAKAVEREKKRAAGEKARRRKSRPNNAQSPTTPVSAGGAGALGAAG